MKISHETFQKARRISKAIQDHLEDINDDGLRSTDLYPILARKNLIEKDKGNGIHFRKFLYSLKNKGALSLIPQCKFAPSKSNPKHTEWHFYRTQNREVNKDLKSGASKVITPKMPEEDINRLINKAKDYVERLPKKNTNSFSYPELETRKLYTRAYEFWSDKEVKLLHRAYQVFGNVDKVAQLLKRQPSAVKQKLGV